MSSVIRNLDQKEVNQSSLVVLLLAPVRKIILQVDLIQCITAVRNLILRNMRRVVQPRMLNAITVVKQDTLPSVVGKLETFLRKLILQRRESLLWEQRKKMNSGMKMEAFDRESRITCFLQ